MEIEKERNKMNTINKKMAVFDLDGTLLNDDRRLSEENKQALQTLFDNGYEVVLASGRPEILMRVYYLNLPFVRFVISSNGGIIRNVKLDEEICSRAISEDAVHKIIEICDRRGVGCDLYSFYGTRDIPTQEIDKEITDEIMFDFKSHILKDRKMTNYPCEKMFLTEENPENLEALRRDIQENVSDVEITQSSFQALDIMSKGVNKGSAVAWLANYLGIAAQDVVAFGDHLNDLEMLQFAGTSIVCSNAVNAVKQVATFVATGTNHENGIAEEIYRHLVSVDRD